jgi:hypothetical protein
MSDSNRAEYLWRVSSFLGSLGFNCKGNHMNRQADEPGLLHAVSVLFGKGSEEGQLSVHLGVFVEEVYEVRMRKEAPKRVKEVECQVRAPLRTLAGLNGWGWRLQKSVDDNVQAIIQTYTAFGAPFLDHLRTRHSLLDENWKAYPAGVFGLDAISRAAILVRLGLIDQAREILREGYHDRLAIRKVAADYLLEVAARMGIEVDAPQ